MISGIWESFFVFVFQNHHRECFLYMLSIAHNLFEAAKQELSGLFKLEVISLKFYVVDQIFDKNSSETSLFRTL